MSGTILIVDDNVVTAKSLAFFLESLGFSTKIWNDPRLFVNEITSSGVGCIILDVRMPYLNGLEVFDLLKQKEITTPVIFLTGHGDVQMAVDAMKRGAFDFFLKPPQEQLLIERIEKAIEISLENEFKARQLSYERKRFERLTDREKDIVLLVGKGLMNKTIADILGISEKTVQQHRGSACKKLNLANAVEISEFLRRLG